MIGLLCSKGVFHNRVDSLRVILSRIGQENQEYCCVDSKEQSDLKQDVRDHRPVGPGEAPFLLGELFSSSSCFTLGLNFPFDCGLVVLVVHRPIVHRRLAID